MSSPQRTRSVEAEFSPSLRAGSESRRHFGPVLDGWNLSRLRSDLDLVLSELVANAVAYGQGPITVSLSQAVPDIVRVEVTSTAGDDTPRVGQPDPGATCGRGLLIVEGIAQDWGHVLNGRESTVWAELRAPT
jgi:signal transduction histidine kinase